MAIKRVKLTPGRQLTEQQIEMLREAEKRPIVFDEDCPEQTEEELAEFYRVSDVPDDM